jgi:hypothetical protein
MNCRRSSLNSDGSEEIWKRGRKDGTELLSSNTRGGAEVLERIDLIREQRSRLGLSGRRIDRCPRSKLSVTSSGVKEVKLWSS